MTNDGTPRYSIAHTEASSGWGGQEIRILSEAQGFIERGHRVIVYAAPGTRILDEAPRFGVPAVAIPIGSKRPRGALALVGVFRSRVVDLVNTHSSTDSWLAALACRWLRMRGRPHPVIVRTRHVAVPIPNNRATRWLYQKATARIVTTGAALREQLVRENGFDPARIDSVPTGIDIDAYQKYERRAARAKLGLPEEVPLIGIVATLRSWKGHRYLVDALPLLARRDAKLVIVGDGPQRNALQEQIAALDLSRRVVLAGQQENVAPWLAALDIFALPSYANEGVPQALLQAMATGVPCVTTDTGAIGEVAREGETAMIVARQSARELAAGIDKILSLPDRGGTMAKRARSFVSEHYGRELMLQRMASVFQRALAESRR